MPDARRPRQRPGGRLGLHQPGPWRGRDGHQERLRRGHGRRGRRHGDRVQRSDQPVDRATTPGRTRCRPRPARATSARTPPARSGRRTASLERHDRHRHALGRRRHPVGFAAIGRDARHPFSFEVSSRSKSAAFSASASVGPALVVEAPLSLADTSVVTSPRQVAGPLLAAAALAAATIPVAGVFTLRDCFFLRDLTLAFRFAIPVPSSQRVLGTWPLWDPYPANGQSAVNDALYQLFHLPSLLIRLLLPEVIAFNVWVALPVPLAAWGAYLFCGVMSRSPRRRSARWRSPRPGRWSRRRTFRTCPGRSPRCRSCSGHSSASSRPRRRERQRCSPRPSRVRRSRGSQYVGRHLAIAAAYVVCVDRGWARLRVVVVSAAGLTAGVLLAAMQFVPLAAASRLSVRGPHAERRLRGRFIR